MTYRRWGLRQDLLNRHLRGDTVYIIGITFSSLLMFVWTKKGY
jgi:hypothetical protein